MPGIINDSRDVHLKFVALSYRGYWTSSGRPSQRGIRMDIAATLEWITETSKGNSLGTEVLVWGQSIGAGIATTGLADLIESEKTLASRSLRVGGLILESPFTSMKEMLIAIYPQRWLPYRYLWPFLESTWDNEVALKEISKAYPNLSILLLEAGRDELVPPEHGMQLARLCHELGFRLSRKIVYGSYHTEILNRPAGRKAVLEYLQGICSAVDRPGTLRQKPPD